MEKKIIYLIVFLFISNISFAENIYGNVKVVDGDSIHIGAKKIRLFGIDAPELKQKCKKAYLSISFLTFQKSYDCGLNSKKALIKKINNKKIFCKTRSKDRYGRDLAICYLEKKDLNMWMVQSGNAIAYKKYSKRYLMNENEAKKKKIGLWSGTFLEPEKWRRKYK
tara:strand:- start:476 stop:973 length:498 start_codon:yes stop_codon:yes gene_type:complete